MSEYESLKQLEDRMISESISPEFKGKPYNNMKRYQEMLAKAKKKLPKTKKE